MGMILHDWNLDKKKMLIQKAYAALPRGGAFVVIEGLHHGSRDDVGGATVVLATVAMR